MMKRCRCPGSMKNIKQTNEKNIYNSRSVWIPYIRVETLLYYIIYIGLIRLTRAHYCRIKSNYARDGAVVVVNPLTKYAGSPHCFKDKIIVFSCKLTRMKATNKIKKEIAQQLETNNEAKYSASNLRTGSGHCRKTRTGNIVIIIMIIMPTSRTALWWLKNL